MLFRRLTASPVSFQPFFEIRIHGHTPSLHSITKWKEISHFPYKLWDIFPNIITRTVIFPLFSLFQWYWIHTFLHIFQSQSLPLPASSLSLTLNRVLYVVYRPKVTITNNPFTCYVPIRLETSHQTIGHLLCSLVFCFSFNACMSECFLFLGKRFVDVVFAGVIERSTPILTTSRQKRTQPRFCLSTKNLTCVCVLAVANGWLAIVKLVDSFRWNHPNNYPASMLIIKLARYCYVKQLWLCRIDLFPTIVCTNTTLVSTSRLSARGVSLLSLTIAN